MVVLPILGRVHAADEWGIDRDFLRPIGSKRNLDGPSQENMEGTLVCNMVDQMNQAKSSNISGEETCLSGDPGVSLNGVLLWMCTRILIVSFID